MIDDVNMMRKEKDPVCGMLVDPEKTPHKYVYKDKVYYFCSEHCLHEFRGNPGKHVK